MPGISVGKIKFSDEIVSKFVDNTVARDVINEKLALSGEIISPGVEMLSSAIQVEESEKEKEVGGTVSTSKEGVDKGIRKDSELTYVCKASGKIVNVPGDGNCFFYAVIGALSLAGYTPGLLKEELLKSKLLEKTEEPVKSELVRILTSKNEWGLFTEQYFLSEEFL